MELVSTSSRPLDSKRTNLKKRGPLNPEQNGYMNCERRVRSPEEACHGNGARPQGRGQTARPQISKKEEVRRTRSKAVNAKTFSSWWG